MTTNTVARFVRLLRRRFSIIRVVYTQGHRTVIRAVRFERIGSSVSRSITLFFQTIISHNYSN